MSFKKSVFILLVASTISVIPLQAQIICQDSQGICQTIDKKELQSIAVIAEVLDSLRGAKGSSVWPGYDLSSIPTVITFKNGHVAAFNLEENHSAWKELLVKGYEVLFSDNDNWGIAQVPMHPHFPIDGQSAFVFSIDAMNYDLMLPFLVFIHERFHQHQFANFVKEGGQKAAYSDHLDKDNIALGHLEDLILIDFLKLNPQRIDERKELLKDFLAINKMRSSLIQPASLAWEQDQQRMEGLADYVSFRFFDQVPIFAGFSGSKRLALQMEQSLRAANISDRAIKWRHYGIGASMGYALDFLNVSNWKAQVEAEGVPLTEILDRELALSPEEVQWRSNLVSVKYGYPQILSNVSTTIDQYQSMIHGYLKNYDQTKGVAILLGKPQDSDIIGGGAAKKMLYLADGSKMSLEDSSVSAAADNLWKLVHKEMPFFFQDIEGIREFKVERNLVVLLDDHPHPVEDLLADCKEIVFQSISWKGKTSEFESFQRKGNISMVNGKIAISFDPAGTRLGGD